MQELSHTSQATGLHQTTGLIDTAKSARESACECKACFYLRKKRIGIARITHSACRSCGADMVFGSRITNALCKPCAKKDNRCVCCGGSIDLDDHRESFPFMVEFPKGGRR